MVRHLTITIESLILIKFEQYFRIETATKKLYFQIALKASILLIMKGKNMEFSAAVQDTQKVIRTENGMATFDTSTNPLVDLFFQIGAVRGTDRDISPMFETAYQYNPSLAVRLLMYARDIRGGMGERQVVRDLLKYIERAYPSVFNRLVSIVPEYGRFDDILVAETTEGKRAAFSVIEKALLAGNGLAAKWMPRKGLTAVELRTYLDWTPKRYRKTLVSLTNVVETAMCSKEWNSINFEHVPSIAASRYARAFSRNATEKYVAYRDALVKGDAKINASSIFPHDVIKPLLKWAVERTVVDVAKAQWKALPNYVGAAAILPMCDVSGSMGFQVSPGTTALDISVAMGLYCADKNTGPFKDMFLTFSGESKIQLVHGDIEAKIKQISTSVWDMNTNLHSAFEEVLRIATKKNVDAADMPKYILILSDMEFDACVEHDDNAMQMIKRKYASAGYEIPNIVFWNLHSDAGQVPVKMNEKGAALVSGFSPAILTAILNGKDFTPEGICLEAITSSRYDLIDGVFADGLK